MVKPIRKVLLKHPKNAYRDKETISSQFLDLNYNSPPDLAKAQDEFNRFTTILESCGAEIHYLPAEKSTTLDSIYTHDPCVVSNSGVILCSMGKPQRQSEPAAMRSFFKQMDIPILGKINPPGQLEGGDVVWINDRVAAVGEGYRSNSEGINQFRKLLGDSVDEVISVPLPHWTGPEDCLHLMSIISPIDYDLYLVYSRLLPIPFRQFLINKNIRLIEVANEEYDTMACNVLAVAPKKCIMLEGNPITKKKLEAQRAEVHTYKGSEISLKGAGGPTCLTRPILRTAA